MMKISKVFKRDEGKGAPQGEMKPAQAKEAFYQGQTHVDFRSILPAVLAGASGPDTKELYDAACSLAKRIYAPDTELTPSLLQDAASEIERAVNHLKKESSELLYFCLSDYQKADEHFYYHIVNGLLISLVTGIGLGYDISALKKLGLAAILRDIGIKGLEAGRRKDILGSEEYNKMLIDPDGGIKYLRDTLKDLSSKIAVVADKSSGLKDDELEDYARIAGLADAYEALMHNRPKRKKKTALEAVDAILDNKDIFGAKFIKQLLEGVGIFPVGTSVYLNTKEIGVVLRNNPDYPMRPVVYTVIDAHGQEVKEPRPINLAHNSVVYIEGCYKEAEAAAETT